MRDTMILIGLLTALALLASGCPDETVDDDDDTYGEDDDTGDDDTTAGDDDTSTTDDDTSTTDDDTSTTDDDDTSTTDDDDDTSTTDDDDDDVSTSCHPWDPIDIAGAEWTYASEYMFQYEADSHGDSGTEVVTAGGTATFEGANVFQRTGTFTGSQATVMWTGYDNCGVDGNVDHGSFFENAGQQGSGTTINSPEVLYLPYAPDAQIGYTWQSHYTQTLEAEAQGQGDSWDYEVHWIWEIVEMTSVTVGAGTFNAVHIHCDYTTEDPLGEHAGTLDTYWVEGLGLVKWDEQRPAETGQYILRELTSYSGPLSP
jgi:hypothetical protein